MRFNSLQLKKAPQMLGGKHGVIFFAAYVLQLQGQLEEAIEHYQRSINTFPTAEAYTFLGWTYSRMGRYKDAIREAQRAIALDHTFLL